MVLGVLQTSRGIRFASLDVRPKKAVDIVRNTGAATKTAVPGKVLFVRPMSDQSIMANSTIGKHMIAAYTANHTGNHLRVVRADKGSFITRFRQYGFRGILALGAVASSAVIGFKSLLPRRTYSLDNGKHLSWPVMKLNRAQFSNMVATGIVAFGLASFALWAPTYNPTTNGGDNPITTVSSGSQRSRESSSSSGQGSNSPTIDTGSSADTAAIQQQPASLSKVTTSVLPAGEVTLPVGGSGGGVTIPVPEPVPTIPTPVVPEPVPDPTIPVDPIVPIIPDVVNPVVNTVDDTVNNTVDTAGGLLGGL